MQILSTIVNAFAHVTPAQWALFFASLALPIIISGAVAVYRFIRRHHQRSPLMRQWHVYWPARVDFAPSMNHGIWTFSRGLRDGIKVTARDPTYPDLEHTGVARYEAGQLMVVLSPRKHANHTLLARFKSTAITGRSELGMALRGAIIDVEDGSLYCTSIIATEHPLNFNDAREALKRITQLYPEDCSLRVLDRPILEIVRGTEPPGSERPPSQSAA